MLLTYVGEDATDSVRAFHRDEDKMQKYLRPMRVATLVSTSQVLHLRNRLGIMLPRCDVCECVNCVCIWISSHQDYLRYDDWQGDAKLDMLATRDKSLEQDFRELRKNLEQAGLFKANLWFYFAMLAHIILLELAGWAVLKYLGTSWPSYCLAVCLIVTAQAQAGWLQHDFGHLSVFESRELNLFCHRFVILHLKAASSAWWNYRHYLHHAKPNIAEADPDINMPYVFMLGLSLSRPVSARSHALSLTCSLAPSVDPTHPPTHPPTLPPPLSLTISTCHAPAVLVAAS